MMASAALLAALKARLELEADLGVSFLPKPAADWHKVASMLTAKGKPAPVSEPKPRSVAAPVRSAERPIPLTVALGTVSSPHLSPPARPAARRPTGRALLVPLIEAPVNAEREEQLAALKAMAEQCRDCELCERRTTVVWGEGSLEAKVMFVGEAPGRDEDEQGRPFVGVSGRLLTDIIEKGMGVPRHRVYITNTVKCRPPGNRDPRPDEVTACSRYLARQMEVIEPAVIVALGAVAGRTLLGLPSAASGMRKQWHELRGVPVRVTYHPSYLLRERKKAGGQRTEADQETWNDIRAVMQRLDAEGVQWR